MNLPARAAVGETPQDTCNRLRVFLNDVEQHFVTVADVEASYVEKYVMDERGRGPIIAGDDFVREIVKGSVRLEWRD